MPRPSRNVDEQLLRAGRELYPAAGYGGLSLRKVAEHARVNLGMFHYHFRTKDAFVRQLLQGIYDEMFASLVIAAEPGSRPLESLRNAVLVIARFMREQRRVVRRIIADAMEGQAVARDFLQSNIPRHFEIVVSLVAAGQRSGELRPVALPQAVAFIAGAVGAPVLLAGAIVDGGFAGTTTTEAIDRFVLSDAAIAERIDLALAGLAMARDGE